MSKLKILKISGVLLLAIYLGACDGEGETEPIPAGSLAAFIEEQGLPVQRDSLIACAASGQHGFLTENSGLPVSVIYLPVSGAGTTMYFETTSPDANPADLREYQQRELNSVPLLNGFLSKFTHPGVNSERTGIVVSISRGKVFISNPIVLKVALQPTLLNPNEVLVNTTDPLMPAFAWQASEVAEDAIYFHVVSDGDNNLISGTYTFEANFQFYNLSNVVLNINETDPAPALQAGEDYTFSVMAVSIDNWVNTFWSQRFRTD